MAISTGIETLSHDEKHEFVRSIARVHRFELEYCAPCNYRNIAVKLADDILAGWAPMIKHVELQPTAWATFELTLDDELLYSKLARSRFPREGEISKLIEDRLGPAFPIYPDHPVEGVDAEGFPMKDWSKLDASVAFEGDVGDPEITAAEGDPNDLRRGDPRGRGPQVAWVKAADLVVGETVLLSAKYVHTISESISDKGELWQLTLTPERLGRTLPTERHIVLNRNSPFRKIVAQI